MTLDDKSIIDKQLEQIRELETMYVKDTAYLTGEIERRDEIIAELKAKVEDKKKHLRHI